MARGQQKIQSQQKNAKKAAEKKKSHGADQKTAAKAALVHTCPVCRVGTNKFFKTQTRLQKLLDKMSHEWFNFQTDDSSFYFCFNWWTISLNLKFFCLFRIFQTQMPDPKTFKQHFESKHPKSPIPPELADVQA